MTGPSSIWDSMTCSVRCEANGAWEVHVGAAIVILLAWIGSHTLDWMGGDPPKPTG